MRKSIIKKQPLATFAIFGLLLLYMASCIPPSNPYPNEPPAVVVADAQKLSDSLESYIKKWLQGKVPAQIPDNLVPFEGIERKSFYLKLPQDVTEQDAWMIRPARAVKFDSLLAGQPDPNVTYYVGASPLAPFGSKLIIEGEFPHARFFSIQLSPPLNGKEYYSHPFGSAEVGIVDADINPLPGHVNPYRVGANRNATNRSYHIEYNLSTGDPVALNGQAHVPLYRQQGNTRTGALIVYRGPFGFKEPFTGKPNTVDPSRYNYGAIWIRTYAPDKGTGPRGGVALPKIYCQLSTGEKYFIACDNSNAIKDLDRSVAMRKKEGGEIGNFFGKYGEWGKEFGLYRQILSGVCKARDWDHPDSIQRIRDCDLGGIGRGEFQPAPGNYEIQATINNYATYLSHGLPLDTTKIAVVVGKLPNCPKTRNGESIMTAGQLRYFSIGAYDNDPFSPLPGACVNMLMDDELNLDNNGNYMIVYSRTSEKPSNAKSQNKVNWLNWGTIADLSLTIRYVTVGPEWEFEKSPHEKNLTYATTDFAGSKYDRKLLQNSHKGWMGCYLPRITFMTKAEFEQLGNSFTADDIPVFVDPTNYIGYNDSEKQPSTASSQENTTNVSSAAFDGDLNTRWSSVSSSAPQWLTVDLGTIKKISGIKLFWHFFNATSYEILVSNNNSTWTSVYSTTAGDGGIDIINGLKTSGRYVRMRGTVAASFGLYSLLEMEVFSPEMNCRPLSTTSIPSKSINMQLLSVYPNPASNFIKISHPYINSNDVGEINLFDINGKLLFTKATSSSVSEIDIEDYQTGLYFVRVKTVKGTYTEKFVKTK